MFHKIITILLLTITSISAQLSFQFLKENEIPESFKKTYSQKPHDYNPLHVGDIWQYNSGYSEKIAVDTLINGKYYFKRVFPTFVFDLFVWERNDSLKQASYLFDNLDLDRDNITDEELPLDSLELTNFSVYTSYKRITEFSNSFIPDTPYVALIEDSSWAVVFGDTVMTRRVQYLAVFTTEIVADKYGVIWSMTEGPPKILTGAIIDGIQYGTIVSLESEQQNPFIFSLSQNYPNPFNPSTTIEYNLNESGYVKIVVYDILGRQVDTLLSDYKNAGTYRIKFNANELASGVYFYSIIFNNQIITKQMLLLG